MDLVTKKSGGNVVIDVVGNIKSISDGQTIKDAITRAFHDNQQAFIDLWIKSIKVDKMFLHVSVGSQELYEMLLEMSLVDAMNVRKV